MNKKGAVRLRRVLGASIKNSRQANEIIGHLTAVEMRLQKEEIERAVDQLWDHLKLKVDDVIYATRNGGTYKHLFGRPLQVGFVFPRLRQVVFCNKVNGKAVEMSAYELMVIRAERAIPPEAFEQLCEAGDDADGEQDKEKP